MQNDIEGDNLNDLENLELIPLTLNPQQKKIIDDNWDKMRLPDLVKRVFNNPKLDGRCAESKSVKEYLGGRQPLSTLHVKKGDIELTETQKEYIRNNCRNSTATEMARELFNNRKLSTLSSEARTVLSYLKTLSYDITGKDYEDTTSEEYRSPNTIRQMLDKVNEYVLTNYEFEKLNGQQKKMFEALISLMKSPRFLQMINSYVSKVSRRIFEGEFIRTIYDKPDLTSDELNLCLNLVSNYVQQITVNKHLDMLNERFDNVVGDPDNKISISLSEMITAKTRELNDIDARIQKLIKDLNGSRAERNKNKIASTLSIATLVEFWKDQREREMSLKRAELRKQELNEELKRLEDFPDIKCRLLNFSRSELLQGEP